MGRVLILLAAAAIAASQGTDLESCLRKFDRIRQGRAPAGSRVVISSNELNAYVRSAVPRVAPQGVRDPVIRLTPGRAVGRAYIDFAKVRRSQGQPMGWMLEKLLEGERPVTVEARIVSSGGFARVDVERVEISGLELSGDTLDYLIRNFLWEYYPDARVGKPFELEHGMDRLEIGRGQVAVVMASRDTWRSAAPR
ncbi:MAG: hypothetical protein ACM3ZB_07660 [bacterium]